MPLHVEVERAFTGVGLVTAEVRAVVVFFRSQLFWRAPQAPFITITVYYEFSNAAPIFGILGLRVPEIAADGFDGFRHRVFNGLADLGGGALFLRRF